jgi:hypothetical protein
MDWRCDSSVERLLCECEALQYCQKEEQVLSVRAGRVTYITLPPAGNHHTLTHTLTHHTYQQRLTEHLVTVRAIQFQWRHSTLSNVSILI